MTPFCEYTQNLPHILLVCSSKQSDRDFEEGAVGLLSFPFPSVTCSKAYAGRERVVTAFEKYHNDNGPQTASHFVKARGKTSNGYNLSVNDQARFDAVNGHAILANTTPTAFWTLFHILSDAKLLEEVRQQVMPLLEVEDDNATPLRTICISKIRDVPILNSILHESLRHYASGTGSRIVLEDTMLDDRYLLKKDCFIFMPNHSYHFDGAAWGPTVKEFDATRFLKENKSTHHAGAFRGFGGGVNLCPGRFFAMNEILSMCAMLALRYDITPTSKEGWIHPGEDNSNMSLIVNPPKQKIGVNVVARKGWEGGSWAFRI